jgi:hypothetical protein
MNTVARLWRKWALGLVLAAAGWTTMQQARRITYGAYALNWRHQVGFLAVAAVGGVLLCLGAALLLGGRDRAPKS